MFFYLQDKEAYFVKEKKKILDEIISNSLPIIDQAPDIMFYKHIDYVYAGANKRLLEFSKLNKLNEVIGKDDYNLPWAENANYYRKIDESILLGNQNLQAMRVRVASGELVEAIQKKMPIRDPVTHEVIGVMAVMREVKNKFLHQIFCFDTKIPQNIILPQYTFANYTYRNQNFSDKESACLFYLIRGLKNKAIGMEMGGISEKAVEKYIEKLKQKLDCKYKSDIHEKALNLGMLYIIPPSISIASNKLG
jgi:DNA-binding CsgD family transcriptional regulator